MKKCSSKGCKNPVWKNSSECVLHCEKRDYSRDSNSLLLCAFYDSLVKHIRKFKTDPDPILTEAAFINCFSRELDKVLDSAIAEILRNQYIILTNIWFPDRNAKDSFDYLNIFSVFGEINFTNCTFSSTVLELEDTMIFFKSCTFNTNWQIKNHNPRGKRYGFIYEGCTFKGDVWTSFGDNEKKEIESPIFTKCCFNKEIYLKDTTFKSMIFDHSPGQKVENSNTTMIRINNCVFESMFALSSLRITNLNIKQSQFRSEFLLKSCVIYTSDIEGSEFNASTEFDGTFFGDFSLSHTVFKDFTSFVGCKFGIVEKFFFPVSATFKYVTFLGICSFRSAIFHQGLDLQNTSMKDTPNFLNIKVNEEHTNRETFRIIKSAFDKSGNYIEGNRYYRREMAKYREEIKTTRQFGERILFELYHLCSDYGQSFKRPLFAILFTSVIYGLILVGYHKNFLYKHFPSRSQDWFAGISNVFNQFAKTIIPFRNSLEEGIEFISLTFNIIYTILIWFIILAIKRKTKR